MFENGTSVRARSFEDAIKTLKSAREITRVEKISNSWDVGYGRMSLCLLSRTARLHLLATGLGGICTLTRGSRF